MHVLSLLSAALFVVPFLAAQDPAEHPNPKLEQHEALRALAGDWTFTMAMAAMPGVPGMEQPSECAGHEHAELICGGLWLRSAMSATWQGTPWQGVWLCGYDPVAKKYTGIMVSSDDGESGAHVMDGQFDGKTRTWTWTGTTPMGEVRSAMTFPDADTTVETCFMSGEDGKQKQFMQITRKRAEAPRTVDASASAPPTGLAKEQQRLLDDVGTWQATVECSMDGQALPTEQGSERIAPICNGRWTWSEFTGRMGGMPFVGHALVGYDRMAKDYVSFWFDSMSAACARTTGSYDEKSRTFTFRGTCTDGNGKPSQISETLTRKDADTRVLRMQTQCDGKQSTMAITYQRQDKR